MPKRVPTEGPKDAKIVLLGESPGGEEVRRGRPFVGPAGGQLDRMLGAAGLQREDLYITNTVKEQPPSQDKDKFFFNKGVPTQAYMDGILELMAELAEVKPNVVVPMGNYALWALTQKTHVSKWRGSIMESTMIPGLKVIPTLHPAFYIHQGHYNSHKEALGIWDLQRVAEESKTPEICLPQAEFIINPAPDEIDRAIERLLAGDHITADTEWYSPENLACIGFTNSPDWAISIPARSMLAYRAYKEILSSPLPKIFQNAMFDDIALDRIGIRVENMQHDTMIEWHACWAGLGEKSLEVIASVLTRWPYYKDQIDFLKKGDDRGWIYNCTDCVITEEAHQKMQAEELTYTNGQSGYDISMSIYPIFAAASKKGIRADKKRLLEMRKEHLENAENLQRELSSAIGYTINVRSPKQVASLVYDQLGVKRQKRTTEQNELLDIAASTRDDVLKTILTAVIRIRQNLNICSRYLTEDILDKDDRVRTNWNLAGTGAARLSATQAWWNSVAMQTVPEDVRRVLIADPGTVFIGWDLEQAEARIVAVKTRDYDLIEEMNSGVDIHTKLAAMLPFGKTYEELVEMIAEAARNGKSKDSVYERYLSKKCRHAFNYIMGSGTFRKTVNRYYLDTGIGISEGDSRHLRDAYLQLHPGLAVWWEEVRGVANRNPRTMSNFYGRTRQFLGHWSETMHREMVAWEPQSNVADTTTVSISEANREIKKLDSDSQFFCHMHDGGFVQVAEDVALEAAAIVKRCMTRELIIDRTPLVIPVEVKMGPSWGELEKVKL